MSKKKGRQNLNSKTTRASNYTQYKKKYSNPYFQKKKRKANFSLPVFNFKFKIFFSLIVIIVIAGLWVIFFSSYFFIKNIEINIVPPEDNNVPAELRIDPEIIKNIAIEQSHTKLYKIIPQTNIFLFNRNKFFTSVNNIYNYEYITLDKDPLDTINITLKEKNYAILFRENEKLYYVDINKNIISEVESEIIDEKKYPLIENQGKSIINEDKISLDSLNFIISLYSILVKNLNEYKIEKIIINDNLELVNIKIHEGPEIYFDSTKEMDKQYNKLKVLLGERLKDDFLNKVYIDLRFGERVYIR